MRDCVFCQIITKTLPCSMIYDDGTCLVIMDLFPVSDGHCLIIPKEHHPLIEEYDPQLMGSIFGRAGGIIEALKQVIVADGFNLVLSNGEAAGQEVFHTHLHIIPRVKGDGIVWSQVTNKSVSREELDDLALKIKENLAW